VQEAYVGRVVALGIVPFCRVSQHLPKDTQDGLLCSHQS